MALIGYWNLNTDSTDSSGSGFDGTDTGVSYVAGKVGGCASYNGTTSKTQMAVTAIPFGNNFSLTGWIYCKGIIGGATDDRGSVFGAASFLTNIKGIAVRVNPISEDLVVSYGNDVTERTEILITDVISANKQKWYHVAVTWNNATNTMSAYVNGSPKISHSGQAMITTGCPFGIGRIRDLNGSNSYWYGLIDEVRLYDNVLSDADVLALYNSYLAPRFQINIGDAWKAVAGVQINIGDSWKTVNGAQINIGDAWKTI